MSDVHPDRRRRVRSAARPRGIGAWLTTTDHKRIGILYIVHRRSSSSSCAVGFAMLMRPSSSGPDMHLLTPEQYNQIFSMHGTTMIFLFAHADADRLRQLPRPAA